MEEPAQEEKPENTGVNQEIRDEQGRFIPGHSGNPAGKPKGAKNKFSFVRFWQELWEQNPEEFEELAKKYLNDDKLAALVIQMIDGRPAQDVTSAGKALPTPIYNVPGNLGTQEDSETNQ